MPAYLEVVLWIHRSRVLLTLHVRGNVRLLCRLHSVGMNLAENRSLERRTETENHPSEGTQCAEYLQRHIAYFRHPQPSASTYRVQNCPH